MDPRHAILFEPVPIGPKTLPNRFYQVPHATGFGAVKPRTHAAFRGIKAEGGWGGVCTDYAPVSPDADETFAVASDIWTDDDARRLGLVADAIHEHGALAGIELYHGGGESLNGESRYARVAPSQVGGEWRYSSLPREMTPDDIARIQGDFVEAAKRARDVGFDIVYVYGAHGYLMTQLLSTFTNRRTDGYGGSLRNRARFQLETVEKVRAAVGDDCAIAIRTTVAPGRELEGLDADELLEFVALMDPLVDLFDVNVGSWPEDSGTSRYYPEGHQLPWTSRVREATAKPIVGVGRYTNPDTMAAVIRSGAFDLIGAARPAIADPFLPQKIREGRLDEVRECTGANLCILRSETFRHVSCIQNATAGEEYRRGWHPERFDPPADPSRAILVVGGGPAGMECAMTLGRIGYDAVHLVEAEPELGGKLRWTRRLPTLGDWGRVVDHRVLGLQRLTNVEVVLGRRLSAADVLDYGADTVIVATGSAWASDGTQPYRDERIDGADEALTPERVMAGERPRGPRVVVYDTDGYYVGAGVAELLALEGFDVVLMTSLPVVSPTSDETLEGRFLRQHLHDLGVAFATDRVLHAIDHGTVAGRTAYGDAWTVLADGVVLVTQQHSEDTLYRELASDPDRLLAAGIEHLLLVGDAAAPRLPSEAVFDGHRVARELEREDPTAPRPWRREGPAV
ncbi:MAG TPA: FAD-dependent oxidoreductase [Candidatus Nanopelagicales bacterium]|nr:FAD-dependent oxidoreductase [Candidatus Nanopelagicales bacterium]